MFLMYNIGVNPSHFVEGKKSETGVLAPLKKARAHTGVRSFLGLAKVHPFKAKTRVRISLEAHKTTARWFFLSLT